MANTQTILIWGW